MAAGSHFEVDEACQIGETESSICERDLERLFEHIDEKCGVFINRLRDFVEFRTVSSDPSESGEFPKMADFMVRILKKFGIQSTVMDMNADNQQKVDGCQVPLILAETEIDPRKATVLFYSHYDVNPINYHECWADPFELVMTSNDSELHGKGTSAGKGPLLCVINAIGAYRKMKILLPVNVKIVMDPLGTSEEDFTGKYLRGLDTDFFKNIDFVCLCTGRWLGTARPCISNGSRGLCYFSVEVEGPSKDLHSGSYGGLINEPISDLVYLLNSLVDVNGIIRITDIYNDVPPMTKEQQKSFKTVHFSVRELQESVGATELQDKEDQAAILSRLWSQPSLTIHGIQGAFSTPGSKTVIPGKVTGKFSINLVPHMSPSKVKKKVVDYLSKLWKIRKSANKIRVQMTIGKLPWFTDPNNINVIAAKKAVTKAFNTEPDLIRQPNRVRMANILRKMTDASVVMIPIGKANDVTDVDSEKLDLSNYVNGSKIFVAYMMYLEELFPGVKIPVDEKCTCRITGQLASCKCYLQYVAPSEHETNQLSNFIEPPMSINDKPELKYYYFSLLAVQKMQKLQEVMSLRPVVQMGSGAALRGNEWEQSVQELRSSIEVRESRAALQSFSVADLHDESKPRTGGWLIKPSSSPKLSTTTPSHHASKNQNSAQMNPQAIVQPQPSLTALQLTEFRFSKAQNLKHDRHGRFNDIKHNLLRLVQSPHLAPAIEFPGKTLDTFATNPAADRSKIESDTRTVTSLVVKSRHNSAIAEKSGLSLLSEVSHPNVEHPVKPRAVISSTSRILYDKRLQKQVTESMHSLKSEKVVGSLEMDSLASLARLDKPTPGELKFPVLSSLSNLFYDRRMNKVLTDSMKGVMSGVHNLSLASTQGLDNTEASSGNPKDTVASSQNPVNGGTRLSSKSVASLIQ